MNSHMLPLYLQIVKELVQHSNKFRILALSATPGNDLKVKLF